MLMRVKSNIGKIIDESPYKREYIRKHFNKSRNTISNWCTGKSYPSVPELFELVKILNVKVDEMYEVIDDDKE
jgi:transcriptional regulator with XRE-family HTH domain